MELNLNTFTCTAYIPRDPKYGTTSGGKPFVSFGISVRTGEKREGMEFPPSLFIMANVWGKEVERAKELIKKGKRIACTGFLSENTWTKDGTEQKGLRLDVIRFEMLSKPDPVSAPAPADATGYDPFGED